MMGNHGNDTIPCSMNYKHLTYKFQSQRLNKISFLYLDLSNDSSQLLDGSNV
jgi:hypothetical protein